MKLLVAASKLMPAGASDESFSGTTGALPQVKLPTVAEVNDAGLVTNPPCPSGRRQRMGTSEPRVTRFSVGGACTAPRNPSKLNCDSTVNACVSAVVKLTASLAVTLKVRAPAVRVLMSSPLGFGAAQLTSDVSAHE